jgi:hypothetical protein
MPGNLARRGCRLPYVRLCRLTWPKGLAGKPDVRPGRMGWTKILGKTLAFVLPMRDNPSRDRSVSCLLVFSVLVVAGTRVCVSVRRQSASTMVRGMQLALCVGLSNRLRPAPGLRFSSLLGPRPRPCCARTAQLGSAEPLATPSPLFNWGGAVCGVANGAPGGVARCPPTT